MAFAIPNGSRVNVARTYQAPITFVAGGGRMIITSTLVRIFDSNNVLRLRMGLW